MAASFQESRPERFSYATFSGPSSPGAAFKTACQTQLSIPVTDGLPLLGTWQGIYLYEHRTSPHQRELVLHFTGEPSPK
jgi:thiamine phosphate synthase YjbQ (UPF0047 family)